MKKGCSSLSGRTHWSERDEASSLTTCTSESTLDRKSSSSLLSMVYGSLSFLVNLFTPEDRREQTRR